MNREKKQTKEEKKTETLWKKTKEQKKNQVVHYRNKEPEHVKQIKLWQKKQQQQKPFLDTKKIPYACVIVKCVSFTHIPLRQKKKKRRRNV